MRTCNGRNEFRLWILALCFATWLPLCTSAVEPNDLGFSPVLVVNVQSGRTFVGDLDPRTDEDHLWLRMDVESTSIFRPIAWSRVTEVRRNGVVLSATEVRRAATRLESKVEYPPRVASASLLGLLNSSAAGSRAERLTQSVEIFARAANWDRDSAFDGLQLSVYAYDELGDLRPSTGRLEVELYGSRAIDFAADSQGAGWRFERLAQWSLAFTADDFASRGLIAKLPFEGFSPETDTRISPEGLLHVKWIVPGQGVYEATQDGIRLRSSSALRNRLESHSSRRPWGWEN